jgi:hypothetical protein
MGYAAIRDSRIYSAVSVLHPDDRGTTAPSRTRKEDGYLVRWPNSAKKIGEVWEWLEERLVKAAQD